MENISIDFSKKSGKMKPMHAVNNGPVYTTHNDTQTINNLDAFIEAGIPYGRTHDSSFYYKYGGEHTVDINAIFPNFDADVNNENSYDFTCTDDFIKAMITAGMKPFYRLGSKIEHGVKKYGTLPPKDNQKWAEICEHIIRHFTEGWADGFNYDIEYWEIWNEPDYSQDDDEYIKKPCWGGTKKEFFELYKVAAKHLKNCFPHLKIGGPAVTYPVNEWTDEFLTFLKENDVPLDFLSWHSYWWNPPEILDLETRTRDVLDTHGFNDTESILNEWNFILGWGTEEFIESLKTMRSLKGASFCSAMMCGTQYRPVDMLMYYDARPCNFNAMFDNYIVSEKLIGYYPFKMFNSLYKLGDAFEVISDCEEIYSCAASNENECAVMLTYYGNDKQEIEKNIKLNLKGIKYSKIKVSYFLLDDEHFDECVKEEVFSGEEISLCIKMAMYSVYLLKIELIH